MLWQAWVTPAWVQRPVEVLAGAAIPMMLLILGMQMAQSTRSLQWRWVGLVTLLRMLVMPLIAIGIAKYFPFNAPVREGRHHRGRYAQRGNHHPAGAGVQPRTAAGNRGGGFHHAYQPTLADPTNRLLAGMRT